MLGAFSKPPKVTEYTNITYLHSGSTKFMRLENSCLGDIVGRGVAVEAAR